VTTNRIIRRFIVKLIYGREQKVKPCSCPKTSRLRAVRNVTCHMRSDSVGYRQTVDIMIRAAVRSAKNCRNCGTIRKVFLLKVFSF